MLDEKLLYTEILQAIKKRGGERLQIVEGQEEINFYPEDLIRNLNSEIKRYEPSIRNLLGKMVQHGILNKGGSPLQYSITKKFEKEYEKFCKGEIV
ncbi:MAG: hypothetical protein WC584_01320 [Candidatus Pacearchaeota archaeon]